MKQLLTLLGLLFCCNLCFSQEKVPERETTYAFSINKLKTQEQVNNIEEAALSIDNVTKSELDWLNYSLKIVATEGGNKGVFPLEKLKAVLIENKAELVSFSKSNH